MRTDTLEPTRGMLDLSRTPPLLARCCAQECGWEGIPTYRNGEASTHCPACEGAVDIDEIEAELNDEEWITSFGKVGRNEPCPCGSGRKFKRCHG